MVFIHGLSRYVIGVVFTIAACDIPAVNWNVSNAVLILFTVSVWALMCWRINSVCWIPCSTNRSWSSIPPYLRVAKQISFGMLRLYPILLTIIFFTGICMSLHCFAVNDVAVSEYLTAGK